MLNSKILLFFICIYSFSFSQKKNIEFNTTSEYLNHVNKVFKIPSNEIYYFSTETDTLNMNLEKYGIMLFITDNKIATVQEVADILNTQCSPKRLLPTITNDDILKASSPTDAFQKLSIKNLETGAQLNRDGDKFAIYMFSHLFGKNAKMYYNERKELEKLGYKTIVISLDGAYIKDLGDIDKTPVYIK